MNQALVIDCTKQTECALFQSGRYIQTTSQEQNKQQEDIMCGMVDELLSQNNTSINKIDTVVVCVGPGSFTGIRKAISYCCGITFFGYANIIGVNALRAMHYKMTNMIGNNYKMAHAHCETDSSHCEIGDKQRKIDKKHRKNDTIVNIPYMANSMANKIASKLENNLENNLTKNLTNGEIIGDEIVVNEIALEELEAVGVESGSVAPNEVLNNRIFTNKTLSIAILPCNGTMLYFSICICVNGAPVNDSSFDEVLRRKTTQEGTATPEEIFTTVKTIISQIVDNNVGISHIDIALCDTVPNLLKQEIQNQADIFENEPTSGAANSYSLQILVVNAQLIGEYAIYLADKDNNGALLRGDLADSISSYTSEFNEYRVNSVITNGAEISNLNKANDLRLLIEGNNTETAFASKVKTDIKTDIKTKVKTEELTNNEKMQIIMPHYIKPPSITQKPKIPQ